METESKINLLDLDRDGLIAFFAGMGESAFRSTQVLKWIYVRGARDFGVMSDLSKDLRARLGESAEIILPDVVREQRSDDGSYKWLLRMSDGNCIETVFIPEDDRGTLCVSSQVGCTLNCSFCSTAQQGYNRNLSTGEIIGQVLLATQALGQQPAGPRIVSNVVMMGMGEPLLNYDNVVAAMKLMLDDFAFGLSRRRVTLSTAGVIPGIEQLRKDCDVSLAVSLHAPEDQLRNELVPLNRKYPIKELMAACKRYVGEGRRRVTFEYVMLDGVNDSDAHARQLVHCLQGVPAKVNLIPFNPFPQTKYTCSSPERLETFHRILMSSGLVTLTRKTRGDDIDAACGQLAGKFRDRTQRRERRLARSRTGL